MKNLEMLIQVEKGNKLQELYKEIFIDNCYDCETLEDIIAMYENNEFSCISGCIGELIYYSQTEAIFKNHFNEIFELVEEFKENSGMNLDIELTANNLVWFTFEYMINVFCIVDIKYILK